MNMYTIQLDSLELYYVMMTSLYYISFNSTHGLVHLVHARNIHTVGNISSLTEQQIQTLPIKTPKVENLKQALRNFQQQLVQVRIILFLYLNL